MRYLIEPAQKHDVPSILELYNECWRETYVCEEAGVTKDIIEQIISKKGEPKNMAHTLGIYDNILESPDCLLEVFRYDGQIKGVVYGERINEEQTLGIYVAKEFWGTGVSYELMSSVESWLDSGRVIAFEVVEYNQRAIRFYEKLGFAIDQDTPVDSHRGIPVLRMLKHPNYL